MLHGSSPASSTMKTTKKAAEKKKPVTTTKKKKEPKVSTQTQHKHRKVIKKMVQNGGISLQEAMRQVGYSEAYIRSAKIKTTDTFQEMLNKVFPDDIINAKTVQLLNASRLDHQVFPQSMTDEEIKEVIESVPGCKLRKIKHSEQANHAYFWNPDNRTQKDILDMLHKLKGTYAPEKWKNVDPFAEMSDAELDAEIERLEKKLRIKKK